MRQEARSARPVHVAQPLLPNPHLIFGRKWDLRTYVLVTSTVPLRAYVYERGLVRFAGVAYDATAKRGGGREAFLTNTSVNKAKGRKMTDVTRTFEQLKEQLAARGEDDHAAVCEMLVKAGAK